MKQRPEEKIRAFSVRLKIAGRKCGFKGPTLDNMCVNCLKRGCALHLTNLLNNCLPQTPFDEMVEHATQYERRQEVEKGEKRLLKGKVMKLILRLIRMTMIKNLNLKLQNRARNKTITGDKK